MIITKQTRTFLEFGEIICILRGFPDWVSVATWRWIANDDNCGICRMPFESCCTECTLPGDDCPLGMFLLLT